MGIKLKTELNESGTERFIKVMPYHLFALAILTFLSFFFLGEYLEGFILFLTYGCIIGIYLLHFGFKLLVTKYKLKGDSPQLILWTGLISTFIGFTLSIVASEIQKDIENKANLVTIIDASIKSNEIDFDAISNQLLNSYLDIGLFKDEEANVFFKIEVDHDAIEFIKQEMSLYEHLSDNLKHELFNWDSMVYSVEAERYPDNPSALENLIALDLLLNEVKYKNSVLNLEKLYQLERIDDEEYRNEKKLIIDRFSKSSSKADTIEAFFNPSRFKVIENERGHAADLTDEPNFLSKDIKEMVKRVNLEEEGFSDYEIDLHFKYNNEGNES